MVIVRSKLNQWWHGERYTPGDKMPANEKQAQALTSSGQAYYDFEYEDEVPTMDNKKHEIIDYLEAKEIEFTKSMKKAELLELI